MMKKLLVAAAIALALPIVAHAQAQAPVAAYAPLDEDLWKVLVQGIGDTPMAFSAHQNLLQLAGQLQQEAQRRAAASKAPAAAPPKPTEPPKAK